MAVLLIFLILIQCNEWIENALHNRITKFSVQINSTNWRLENLPANLTFHHRLIIIIFLVVIIIITGQMTLKNVEITTELFGSEEIGFCRLAQWWSGCITVRYPRESSHVRASATISWHIGLDKRAKKDSCKWFLRLYWRGSVPTYKNHFVLLIVSGRERLEWSWCDSQLKSPEITWATHVLKIHIYQSLTAPGLSWRVL